MIGIGIYFLLIISLLTSRGLAVKEYLFRSCDQNPFCKRNRYYADRVIEQDKDKWKSPYKLDLESVIQDKNGGRLYGTVYKTIAGEDGGSEISIELPLTVSFLTSSGSVRISLDEKQRRDNEIEVYGNNLIRPERYNVSEWAFAEGALISGDDGLEITLTDGLISVIYGQNGVNKIDIQSDPLKFTFYRHGISSVVLNEKGLLNYEHWRPIEEREEHKVNDPAGAPDQQIVAQLRSKHLSQLELDEGLWEDEFDGKKDVRSRGPESIALDIEFSGYEHVYGIPEHADSMSLKETRGGDGAHNDPYRLFNVDIFEYQPNSPMAMYGAIPFIQAHKQGQSAGVFWANAADTYIDITKSKSKSKSKSVSTHWMSETGLLDVFILLGDNPSEISSSYAQLTGHINLPQIFTIAYHQCRWNYNTQEDVLEVNEKFNEHGIPYDVIWLDIEYTDEKKYFTWNKALFPDHSSMLAQLDKSKRKLVAIIDPHIKVADNYDVFKTIKNQLLAVKNSKGELFYGHCWPGESVWIDTLSPEAREYWTSLFSTTNNEFGSDSSNLHIWNDMNEPSVFSGPETTMPKDNIHHGGWEHRDIHNLFGLTFHNATLDALNSRYDHQQRPFILTRSYFAGSQRLGAMWTGDNSAEWEYLKQATPMLLTSGIAGMPFCGADVGGFFGNPSSELLTRWYQAGAFYPFFRGHAHIDSKRREPYLIPPPYNTTINDAIKLRYRLLPTFYTAFHQSSIDGSPVLKPVYYIAPDNDKVFSIDDQFFVGNSGILVKPVTDEGSTSVDIYLPDHEIYYDYDDNHYAIYRGEGLHTIQAPLDKIPILLRGGHIHTRRDRFRRSSTLMKHDPYTLIIALDSHGKASGELYIDDGESYNYQKGEFILQKFKYFDKKLQALPEPGNTSSDSISKLRDIPIEKIIIIGKDPHLKFTGNNGIQSVTITEEDQTWKAEAKFLDGKQGILIRNPRMSIGKPWVVSL